MVLGLASSGWALLGRRVLAAGHPRCSAGAQAEAGAEGRRLRDGGGGGRVGSRSRLRSWGWLGSGGASALGYQRVGCGVWGVGCWVRGLGCAGHLAVALGVAAGRGLGFGHRLRRKLVVWGVWQWRGCCGRATSRFRHKAMAQFRWTTAGRLWRVCRCRPVGDVGSVFAPDPALPGEATRVGHRQLFESPTGRVCCTSTVQPNRGGGDTAAPNSAET